VTWTHRKTSVEKEKIKINKISDEIVNITIAITEILRVIRRYFENICTMILENLALVNKFLDT
jgi:hypothetical protein